MSKELRKPSIKEVAPLKVILVGEIFIYLNLTPAQVGPVRLLVGMAVYHRFCNLSKREVSRVI